LCGLSENLGCGGYFSFAVGPAGVGRERERESVVASACVGSDEPVAGRQVGAGCPQISGHLGKRGLRIGELESDLVPWKQQGGAYGDFGAEQGLDREAVEDSLQFATAVDFGFAPPNATSE
jgi:hypothetical protein